jgi:L-cystine transport system permease protein
MVMNESAFLGEQIRGAILSIPSVQSEAGYSIGMTKTQTFIRIVLPQTIRILVPVFGTTIVGMLQSTSILYMVGVVDIMGRAKSIASSTHHALEAYAAISILYIFFSLLIKLIFNIIERKMSYGRGELE